MFTFNVKSDGLSKRQFSALMDKLTEIEGKMSAQDDKINAFTAEVNTQLAGFGASLQNIADDEKGLLAQIEELKASIPPADLSIDNQTKLADILTNIKAMAGRAQAQADNVPDVVPGTTAPNTV